MRTSPPNRWVRNLAIVVVSAGALVVGLGGNASAATIDDAFSQLQALNPEVNASDLEASMHEAATETGQTYDQVVTEALAESRKNAPVRRPGRSLSSGGGCKQVSLTDGYIGGNVIYVPASTAGIEHGHAGVYSIARYIVEAPGRGKVSGNFPVLNRKYCKGIQKMTVDISVAESEAVGAYAASYLINKPYNVNFAWNKGGSIKTLNCSELVYKAFKRKINVDLDGDGGLGVYPIDIANSHLTHTYETIN